PVQDTLAFGLCQGSVELNGVRVTAFAQRPSAATRSVLIQLPALRQREHHFSDDFIARPGVCHPNGAQEIDRCVFVRAQMLVARRDIARCRVDVQVESDSRFFDVCLVLGAVAIPILGLDSHLDALEITTEVAGWADPDIGQRARHPFTEATQVLTVNTDLPVRTRGVNLRAHSDPAAYCQVINHYPALFTAVKVRGVVIDIVIREGDLQIVLQIERIIFINEDLISRTRFEGKRNGVGNGQHLYRERQRRLLAIDVRQFVAGRIDFVAGHLQRQVNIFVAVCGRKHFERLKLLPAHDYYAVQIQAGKMQIRLAQIDLQLPIGQRKDAAILYGDAQLRTLGEAGQGNEAESFGVIADIHTILVSAVSDLR